jgi:putative tryptophan/tyrosine transport system substrate-binding protein
MRLKLAVLLFIALIVAVIFGYFRYQGSFEPNNVDTKVYKIGLIENHNTFIPSFKGLLDGLEKLGYKEGVNVEYIRFSTEQKAEANKNARADEQVAYWKTQEDLFLSQSPDILITASTPLSAYLSARKFDFPVVFMDIGGTKNIVENPNSPEGNITGITGGNTEFVSKRLEILKELDPSIKKVIISPDTAFPNYPPFIASIRSAAALLGLEIVEIPTSNANEFISKLGEILTKKNGDAFFYFAGPNNTPPEPARRKMIIDQLIKERLLSINQNMELGANEGVLASYGAYRFETGIEAAAIVDNVLTGRAIKDIPVTPPIKSIKLEINLDTAKAIGLTVPQSFVIEASKVYGE